MNDSNMMCCVKSKNRRALCSQAAEWVSMIIIRQRRLQRSVFVSDTVRIEA